MSLAPRFVRSCAALALALYGVVLVKLTLMPAEAEQHTFGLLDRLATALSSGRLHWQQTEVLANVALFVPAGLLLCVLLGRAWAAVLVCLVVSAGIEVAQQRWLPSRVPSIADVEHNGLGGLVGAAFGWPLAFAMTRRAHRADVLPVL